MVITIIPRGSVWRYFGQKEKFEIEVPDGCTCAEALRCAGLDWETCPSFGFVSVNGMKVLIDSPLQDGDQLKAFSKVSGG